jgi:geranylgeranyl diphosphate synthase type II
MIEEYLKSVSTATEDWINEHFKADRVYNEKLYEAMRYSLMAGGKRLRPALLMMAYELFHDDGAINAEHPAIPFAAATEMVHTYSLIHDDLPGMDNDDLRRGKPTNHKVYGEAAAILAGDGLMTKAFEIFINTPSSMMPMNRRAGAAYIMLKSCGPDGMVAGQYVDMLAQGISSEVPEQAKLPADVIQEHEKTLDYIHRMKTSALISACVQSGAVLAGAETADLCKLIVYGDRIGVAFQVADDILDVTASTEELGKPAGSDEKLDKLTYPKFYGLDKSRKMLERLIEEAIAEIEEYGEKADKLRAVAHFIGNRNA